MTQSQSQSQFSTCHNKGFHLTFSNGYTISVQFGYGNYCENKYKLNDPDSSECTESPDAEIAYWKGNGDMIEFEESGDTVLGYQSTNDVAIWIDRISKLPE